MIFSKPTFCLLLAICMAVLAAGIFAGAAQAQVVASAVAPGRALWVGGEYSNIHAGFPYQSSQRLWGGGAFADYHLTGHIGIEAEARLLRFNSFFGETETNYLAGPRYLAGRWGRLQPFAQCLAGMSKIQYPFQIGNGNYLAIAPGAGVNYRLARRLTLRGEYEYQLWPGSPGIPYEPAHQITPSGFHVGVAFRLLR